MKNAFILHGTGGSSKGNWFPWLKTKLEEKNWKVWVPDLPKADVPNIKRYNEFIFSSDWKFDNNSVLVGHSSGAVAILGILQNLPKDIVVDTVVLVGAFKNNLDQDALSGLFDEPFEFEKIKNHAKHIILIHSDNDPYCPLEHAEYLAKCLGAELIMKPGQKHFSIGTGGPAYNQFPLVLELLSKNI